MENTEDEVAAFGVALTIGKTKILLVGRRE